MTVNKKTPLRLRCARVLRDLDVIMECRLRESGYLPGGIVDKAMRHEIENLAKLIRLDVGFINSKKRGPHYECSQHEKTSA